MKRKKVPFIIKHEPIKQNSYYLVCSASYTEIHNTSALLTQSVSNYPSQQTGQSFL